MDALDYEKLLNQLIRLEGDRLDRERLTVLEEDVRAVAQELEEGWPAVRRIDPVRKRVLIHMTFNMTAVVTAQPDCWGRAMTAIIPGDPRCPSDPVRSRPTL